MYEVHSFRSLFLFLLTDKNISIVIYDEARRMTDVERMTLLLKHIHEQTTLYISQCFEKAESLEILY